MKNRVFLLSVALVTVLSIALSQQSNPIVSWFSPATTVEAQATSRTFGREGLDAVLFFFQEKAIKPYVDGVAIDDDSATTQKICELAGYSRVTYLKSRNFASCGDNFIEYWNGSSWIRSDACSRQPFIDTLTCDTPIIQNNAQCAASTVPTTVTAGQPFSGVVTFKNTGVSTWSGNNYYAAIGNGNIWGLSNWGATWAGWPTAAITPGQSVNVPVSGTAPTTPGTYSFTWRMTQNTVESFGENCNGSITVTPQVAPTVDLKINGQDGIIVIPRGTSVTVSWTSTGVARCDTSTSLTPWGPYVSKPVNGSEVFTPTQGLTVGIQCAETLTSNMIVQDSGSGIRFTRCTDGIDNDNDGLVDGNDGGCSGVNDDDEAGGSSSSAPASQCANGYDDDGDGLADINDPGCHTDFNRFNSASYNASGNNEASNSGSLGSCADGRDNNSNGLVDAQDPICHTDGNPGNSSSFNPTGNETSGSSSSSSSSTGICRTATFDASYGSLTNQGWTALNPGANQSVQTLTENGVTFLRVNDQSTTQGLRTEFTSIPDSALADRDWNLEMKARIHNSTENGYVIGMNMLLTSPAGKYASIYIDTDKFGPIGTSINQYNYARTYNADTTNGFHTYAIRYKKNGAGVNDDTFDVLFDGTVVMANVARTEIWDSSVWNQNINGISFGVGSSPGQAQMDVQYVRFQNTDVYNCGSSSSSSSSSTSTGGWQCSNGIDDDGDGQSDANDPGCHTDKNRFNSMSYNPYGTEGDNNRSYTCQDGVDNNTNGLVDSQDPICHWDGNPNNNASFTPNANEGFGGSSSSSFSSNGSAQCNNGYDDDGDALVDGNDPGCHTDRNRYNPASYNPNGTENGNDRNRGCQDGVDNNGNGLVDAQDPICHSDGNPNNPGSFDPNRSEDGGSQGNGCIIIKTRAEDDNGDRIDNNDLPSFTVTLDGGQRSVFTDDGDARFNNLANGSHYVNMLMFGDWEVDSISPSNGTVTVSGSSCKTVTFNITDTGDNGDDHNGDDAEVDVRKTASSSEVFPGGTVEYVITIENTGDVDLENLIVEDRIPSDLTIIDDGDADERHGNELTWEIDIDEGDTETIRYRVAVPSYMFPGQTIRNDVRVTSDDNDIDIDEDASAFISVIGTLPQTGMIGMVSNASAYLTPIRQAAATSSSSGMGTAAAAATTILTGLGGGIALGKKYLGL